MSDIIDGLTRRRFLQTTIVAAGAAASPFGSAVAQSAAAKYTRYNVMSANGQRALASYAKGIQAMLNLPADHPHNWFRNTLYSRAAARTSRCWKTCPTTRCTTTSAVSARSIPGRTET